MAPFPARLHVLLAREAPVGVVIRRGPAKRTAIILWQRERDEFTLGQWFRGRIYERRCDLSADGQHFIYFAMGPSSLEAKGSWTAISRAPYLKALTMLPKGGTWNGGGLWTGPRRYWVDGYDSHTVLHDIGNFERDDTYQPEMGLGGEWLEICDLRLLRNDWLAKKNENDRTSLEKMLPDGWRLRKMIAQGKSPPGKACTWDEYQLVHPATGSQIDCPDWEWADWDRCRLVWATQGKLFAGKLQEDGLNSPVELHDFNGMEYRRIKAPY